MKKVHISLFSKKGEPLVSAIGLIDTEKKVIYIPKVSTKGTNYIQEVNYDMYEGGIATQYIYTEDDKCYVNNYYIHDLREKDSK